MKIRRVETERLIIRSREGVEARGRLPVGVYLRATEAELGSAEIEPGDEPGTFTVSVWLEDAPDLAAEAVAALTRVGLELLGGERVDVIALAEDVSAARMLYRLGFRRAGRALAGEGGPLVERWAATATAAALRMVPSLRVLRSDGESLEAPAWTAEAAGLAVWAPGYGRRAVAEALANYAD
jgi:hypothetical protein